MELLLERKTLNKLNPENTRKILKRIARIVEENPSMGFRGRLRRLDGPEDTFEDGLPKYQYRATLQLMADIPPEQAQKRYDYVREMLDRAARGQGWRLLEDGSAGLAAGSQAGKGWGAGSGTSSLPPRARPRFEPPLLTPGSMTEVFKGIWDRDAHIRIIHAAVERYATKGHPSHTLLHSKPGACKTTMFQRLKQWYEADGTERVAVLDGPTMSKAGLENWLISRSTNGILPEILCIEEIEKQKSANLDCLLSVMASGYISKTTAPHGAVRAATPLLVWATCNDVELLKGFAHGAIWSRFTHTLECPLPNRDLMYRILLREASDEVGDTPEAKRLASEALRFGWDEMGWRDPRKLNGLLDDPDRLLSGETQKDYRSIRATSSLD